MPWPQCPYPTIQYLALSYFPSQPYFGRTGDCSWEVNPLCSTDAFMIILDPIMSSSFFCPSALGVRSLQYCLEVLWHSQKTFHVWSVGLHIVLSSCEGLMPSNSHPTCSSYNNRLTSRLPEYTPPLLIPAQVTTVRFQPRQTGTYPALLLIRTGDFLASQLVGTHVQLCSLELAIQTPPR